MASSLWTTASRAVTGRAFILRSLRGKHTFSPLVTKNNTFSAPFSVSSRQQESSAAASVPFPRIPSQSEPTPSEEPTTTSESSKPSEEGPTEIEFSTLKGKISYDTLKALTVRPFTMTKMTTVQSEVLGLLPALAEPHNPDATKETPQEARDILVKAKTGTGKTFAFLIPAIEARLKAIEEHGKKAVRDAGLTSEKHIEARARRQFCREVAGTLIVSPTRELATQIANSAMKTTEHHKEFEVRLFVGGESKRRQMRDWMKGRRDIVVTTPGRMLDLLENEPEVAKGISKCKMLILDEADTLLDMGFRDDIDAIAAYMPKAPERQTFLFSATVSPAVRQIARSVLDRKHLFIDTVPVDESPVHAHIPQYHTVLPKASDQLPHLLRLLAHDQLINPGQSKTMVFFPTTKMTQLFTTYLRDLGKKVLPAGRHTNVYDIHSKKTMEARTNTSNNFRNDRSGAAILITSDVSARGVDYPGITRVIQVGIPGSTDQYIHRVGRTGRRGGTNGRGDLVLLPWEIGFVTWQLNEVPLKPLTINELKSQVQDLHAKYDADPSEFFEGGPKPVKPSPNRRPGSLPITQFSAPITPRLENMDSDIAELLVNTDEEAINETFTSMLGYYMGKTAELRVQKGNVVEGCKDWTVEAGGLPAPPYVSDAFLAKLGCSPGSMRRERNQNNRRPSNSSNHWVGRGNVRSRERTRSFRDDEDSDLVSRPDNFNTKVFKRKFDDDDSRFDTDSRRSGYGQRDGRSGDRFGQRSGNWSDRSGQRDQRRFDGNDSGFERRSGYGQRDRDSGDRYGRGGFGARE